MKLEIANYGDRGKSENKKAACKFYITGRLNALMVG